MSRALNYAHTGRMRLLRQINREQRPAAGATPYLRDFLRSGPTMRPAYAGHSRYTSKGLGRIWRIWRIPVTVSSVERPFTPAARCRREHKIVIRSEIGFTIALRIDRRRKTSSARLKAAPSLMRINVCDHTLAPNPLARRKSSVSPALAVSCAWCVLLQR